MSASSAAGAFARLTAGAVTDAAGLALAHEPVPAEQVVAGAPTTAYRSLDEPADGGRAGEIGVWEMSVGAMSDIEVDEVFVVLAGSATVEFEHVPSTGGPAESIELAPGAVVRLEAGMRTIWTVREPLRKVFIAR
ncbi:cupin domain-containing protein [Agromyces sp. GXS1127]|uniref:cupin domain-containing protein n=1 Tax=Agromyces sp. GXS1127 TaxID=3424181 RepID=UPI003D31EC80